MSAFSMFFTRICFFRRAQWAFASASAIGRAAALPPLTGAAVAETKYVSGPMLITLLDCAQAASRAHTMMDGIFFIVTVYVVRRMGGVSPCVLWP